MYFIFLDFPDCLAILQSGYNYSGVYTIQIGETKFNAWCDMSFIILDFPDCLAILQSGYNDSGVYTIQTGRPSLMPGVICHLSF